MASVETILNELGLEHLPALQVLNKKDLLPPETRSQRCRMENAIAISATDRTTLKPLIEKMEAMLQTAESNETT
jgi:GTP-binding protein HflX